MITIKQATRYLYLILLPVFFILHHYYVNFNGVSPGELFQLLAVHLIVTGLLLGIFYLFSRNISIAAAFTCITVLFILFFGMLKDVVSARLSLPQAGQYFILLTFFSGCLWLVWYLLAKNKMKGSKLHLFFNLLFTLWIVVEIIQAVPVYKKFRTEFNRVSFTKSDQSEKPSIYIILLDEYPRQDVLQALFGFDNNPFLNVLRSKGFSIDTQSRSNYDLTQFSVASMLTMDYLPVKGLPQNDDYSLAMLRIDTARLWTALKDMQYRLVNFSIFKLDGIPPFPNAYIRNYNLEYFNRTLPGRIYSDFPGIFRSKNKESDAQELSQINRTYNIQRLRDIQNHLPDSAVSEFVYLHLMMPHLPYFFDSTGKEADPSGYESDKNFISYLEYTNKQVIKTIERIQKFPGEKIIYLLSDHGYREDNTPDDFYFRNLSALFSTNNNVNIRKGSTNINQFRNLVNHALGQNFPLVNDSSIHLIK